MYIIGADDNVVSATLDIISRHLFSTCNVEKTNPPGNIVMSLVYLKSVTELCKSSKSLNTCGCTLLVIYIITLFILNLYYYMYIMYMYLWTHYMCVCVYIHVYTHKHLHVWPCVHALCVCARACLCVYWDRARCILFGREIL